MIVAEFLGVVSGYDDVSSTSRERRGALERCCDQHSEEEEAWGKANHD